MASGVARLRLLARSPPVACAPRVRSMSSICISAYDKPDEDVVEFPRVARGLNYDLNWSLAGDKITTRGEAYRNATVRDLLEFLPRKGTAISKARSVSIAAPSPAPGASVVSYATESLPGTTALDVEEAEMRLDSVRDECLSFAPRLFVEDGALGGCREAELRVRIVTDSPAVALLARAALLHRIPLYDPEVFPRTITLYAATLASPDIAAGRALGGGGAPAPPHTILDLHAAAGRAELAAVGAVPLGALRAALATAAAQLMSLGGYRSAPGGSAQSPNLAEARADGNLSWYARDGHWYAPAGEAHPDLLLLPADALSGPAGNTLVVGSPSGAVAAAAAEAGRLAAAHHVVWMRGGLTPLWGGSSLPAASPAAAAAAASVRGAVATQGAVSAPAPAAPRILAAPTAILLVGGAGGAGAVPAAEALARLRALVPLTERAAGQLTARLADGSVKVSAVADEAAALVALGLGAKVAAPVTAAPAKA